MDVAIDQEDAATSLFIQLAQAYEILSDPIKRRQVDDVTQCLSLAVPCRACFLAGDCGYGSSFQTLLLALTSLLSAHTTAASPVLQYDLSGDGDGQQSGSFRAGAGVDPFARTYEEHPFSFFVRFRGGAFKFEFKGTGLRGMPPITVPVRLTLEDLLEPKAMNVSVTRQVTCSTCGGTGASDPEAMEECPFCQGSGVGLHLHEESPLGDGPVSEHDDGDDAENETSRKRLPRRWRGFRQVGRQHRRPRATSRRTHWGALLPPKRCPQSPL